MSKNKGGRPTDYKGKYAGEVYKLCLLGLKDTEIAEFFEVSEKTINNWKKQYPKFLQSMRKGKKAADMKGVQKFFDRVTGYDYDEIHTTTEIVKINGVDCEKVTKKVINKQVAPDVTAGKFWLMNRTRHNKEGFCERIENTHSGPDGGPIQTVKRIIVKKGD